MRGPQCRLLEARRPASSTSLSRIPPPPMSTVPPCPSRLVAGTMSTGSRSTWEWRASGLAEAAKMGQHLWLSMIDDRYGAGDDLFRAGDELVRHCPDRPPRELRSCRRLLSSLGRLGLSRASGRIGAWRRGKKIPPGCDGGREVVSGAGLGRPWSRVRRRARAVAGAAGRRRRWIEAAPAETRRRVGTAGSVRARNRRVASAAGRAQGCQQVELRDALQRRRRPPASIPLRCGHGRPGAGRPRRRGRRGGLPRRRQTDCPGKGAGAARRMVERLRGSAWNCRVTREVDAP